MNGTNHGNAKHLGVFFLCVCMIACISCDAQAPSPFGDLQIFPIHKRAIEPSGAEIAVTHLKIWGYQTAGGNAVLETQVRDMAFPITIKGLRAGAWNISISGLFENNSASVVTKQAQQNVSIQSGKTSTAVFDLAYMTEGLGTCTVTLTWPSQATSIDQAACTLNQGGTEKYTFSESGPFTTSTDLYTQDISGTSIIEVGTYDLDVDLSNLSGTHIPFPMLDTVRIFSQKHSTGTVPLDFDVATITSMISTGSFVAGTTPTISIGAFPTDVPVYYTTDGSEPTILSTRYAGPITLTQSTTIKAVAAADGYGDSRIATGVYTASNFAITKPPNIEAIDIVTNDFITYAAVLTGETGLETNHYSWYVNGIQQLGENQYYIVLNSLESGKRYRIMVKIQKGDQSLNTFSTTEYFVIP